MCLGVVPQQPPTILAYSKRGFMHWANSSGPRGKTVSSPISWGKPAFGCRITGRPPFASSWAVASISFGPTEQFAPTALAPEAFKASTASFADTPQLVRPLASKVMVTQTGKPVRKAPERAAFASTRSVMVSTRIRSAPPGQCLSLKGKASSASWGSRVPKGL